MSEADRVAIRISEETNWAEDPSSPTMEEVRFTGETLRQETDTQQSNEIRDDGQVAEVPRTSINAAGDLNWELSYDGNDKWFDKLLAGALRSSGWSSIVEITNNSNIAVDGPNDKFTTADTATDLSVFSPGQWIKTSGFAESGNNGYFKIASNTASEIVVDNGDNLVTESAGNSVTLTQGAQIVNGTTDKSFLIEREYSDLSSEFAIFKGMMVDAMGLTINESSVATGSFSFVGKDEESKTSSVAGSTNSAPTNSIINTSDHVPQVLENHSDFEMQNFSMNLANNLRQRGVVGVLGPNSLGKGRIALSGSLTAYFQSKTLFDKYLGYNDTSFAVAVQDGDGNGYVIEFPLMRLTAGQRVAEGSESDIIADLSWVAFREPNEDVSVRIARFAA